MRTHIKFCVDFGKTPTKMLNLFQNTRRNMSVNRSIVFKWHRRFKVDCQNLENNEQQGREAQSFTRPVQRQLRRH